MSPRAAWRLASLAHEDVFDYMPGKVDWIARGLPVEGTKADEPRVADLARHDVVTCELTDTASAVHERVARSPYRFALVLNANRVLLGRLRKAALTDNPHARVEDVMEPGPSTTRPHTTPAVLIERLQRADLRTAVLTDPDGCLTGVVRRSDLDSHAH